MLVPMLRRCLSAHVVGPAVSAAAGRAAGLPPGTAQLPGSGSLQLGQAADAEPPSRPRAAAGPLPAGARSCQAAFHQASISVPFSGGEMILSR